MQLIIYTHAVRVFWEIGNLSNYEARVAPTQESLLHFATSKKKIVAGNLDYE